ncbi:ribosomal protein YMR-31 [Cordyceps fumosorosea ARSEF 2679]|uniref:Ribosomal protein YMR-31 n=1 Tax=Cordyceps fumosorosea (strain ARSEF 2679) TaxID=1081104 RepID=A0A167PBW6_CORFA|nr:ribosomal protein YMR-31 [Cordyceps fumosorosea ARSEF 2679]OAA56504.1 ribosomal protein YMR-31 [Cordyceps fumosorosea ARSEF 2679]
MFTTRALRQAAVHAERQPMIKFIGPRSIPSSIDHSPKPHPASPSGTLPEGFASADSSRHASFSSYRDHAQQHGPLQKTIRSGEAGIGGLSGAELGSVNAPKGVFFDISELPARFRRQPINLAEIEAVESGGAAVLG